jgi:anionic cell wall polymer biosynthesis LytR-Cps2A-Psr (LCP) family protein
VSFGGLVDAVGGVEINFANPAFDRSSGLDVKQAGRVRLNGKEALAYVRSRHYVEIVNGRQQADSGGDLSREQRQQTFLRAVLSKAGGTRNPFKLTKVASAATKGLRIDNKMTLWDGFHLAWDMGGFNPASVKLPVVPTTLNNGAQVLLLKQPEAELVLASFRG